MRTIKFLLILHLEGSAHGIARRHDHCLQLFQVKRRVQIRTLLILEHYVYSLVHDGQVTRDYLLVVEDYLVRENKRLVAGQEVTRNVIDIDKGSRLFLVIFVLSFYSCAPFLV